MSLAVEQLQYSIFIKCDILRNVKTRFRQVGVQWGGDPGGEFSTATQLLSGILLSLTVPMQLGSAKQSFATFSQSLAAPGRPTNKVSRQTITERAIVLRNE